MRIGKYYVIVIPTAFAAEVIGIMYGYKIDGVIAVTWIAMGMFEGNRFLRHQRLYERHIYKNNLYTWMQNIFPPKEIKSSKIYKDYRRTIMLIPFRMFGSIIPLGIFPQFFH